MKRFYACRPFSGRAFLGAFLLACPLANVEAQTAANEAPPAPQAQQTIYIREYRVTGAKQLSSPEIEEAVYPFLGPGRTAEDVEQARAALEKAFHDKGYQTVSVEVPQQGGRGGIIMLKVNENPVGRLRVHGSRFFSLADIKRRAPSMAEGRVPNFNDVTRDIIALNQLADRRVTPELKPGIEPGTVDIDLTVKDKFPLHGSVELNNRHSVDTTELRLSAAVSYNNLWQLGHSAGLNFQIAPENTDDAKIFSAFYLMRFPSAPGFSLLLSGSKHDSDVSTLGGTSSAGGGSATAGRGYDVGGQAIFTLPGTENFYHSVSVGLTYKHTTEKTRGFGGITLRDTPIDYYPVGIDYTASLVGKGRLTELDAALNFHFRGMGDDELAFNGKRYGASGSYIYLRGELSHTQDLPGKFQAFAKVQGQLSSQPLINSEQFAGGGLDTARGYLEAAALGDNALFGTLELRSPSLLGWWDKDGKENDWRVYAFVDAGFLTVNSPLPEEINRFDLASYGVGSRIQLFENLHGSIDAGIPLISRAGTSLDGEPQTAAHHLQLTFRVWADF